MQKPKGNFGLQDECEWGTGRSSRVHHSAGIRVSGVLGFRETLRTPWVGGVDARALRHRLPCASLLLNLLFLPSERHGRSWRLAAPEAPRLLLRPLRQQRRRPRLRPAPLPRLPAAPPSVRDLHLPRSRPSSPSARPLRQQDRARRGCEEPDC